MSEALYDVLVRNGRICDGSGGESYVGDVAIQGDRIVKVGSLLDGHGKTEVDATGLVVAPGFVNMLSWTAESLIADGRSQSNIRQGVTLEVVGEGWSMGPLDEEMKARSLASQTNIKYDIEWTTLGGFLDYLAGRGISTNIGSYIGAATPRIYVLGYEDRPPTAEELERMCGLVRQAMEEGALGMASALIYPPGAYADAPELTAMAKVVAEYDGLYISHIRSEGEHILEALDELLTVARETGGRVEIYHLKASGKANWHLLDAVIAKVEAARAEGICISADMYTYTASGTGLTVNIPDWVHEGGHDAMIARLTDPETRARVRREMSMRFPGRTLLVGFQNPALKSLAGKTLGEVAEMRGTSPEDTVIDLIVEDNSRIPSIFFSMSEDNLRKKVALPWVSFGSDAPSIAPEGVFLEMMPHPRAYGTFARVLGRFVRDEGIVPLEEAIRRLTTFPAANLKLDRRGALKPGYYADIAIFDADKVQDHATFETPHQYATGMVHVFVNGTQVLKDGEHTGATPGRVVRGPGWTGAA